MKQQQDSIPCPTNTNIQSDRSPQDVPHRYHRAEEKIVLGHDCCRQSVRMKSYRSSSGTCGRSSLPVNHRHRRWITIFLLCNPLFSALTTVAASPTRAPTASMAQGRRGQIRLGTKKSRRRRLKDTRTVPIKAFAAKKDFQNEAPEEKPVKEDKDNPKDKDKDDPKDKDKDKFKSDFPSYSPSTLEPTTSSQPSRQPSSQPSDKPSKLPSSKPSYRPSSSPSSSPTGTPTDHPTDEPTKLPSSRPTYTPGSPTPLPTIWKSAWHGDFTAKMSIFTFSEGDYVPPALGKDGPSSQNGNRRQMMESIEEHEIEIETTWGHVKKAVETYKKHRLLESSQDQLVGQLNRQLKPASAIPKSRNHENGRYLKITAEDIRNGKEPDLIHDVLTTFAETLCNETKFVILTPRASISRTRKLDEALISKMDLTQDREEEEDVLVDFCLNDEQPVDRFKDYSKRDTVLHAHFANSDPAFPILELEDRDTYVNDFDSLHWVEWEVHFDVIQVDRFTLAEVGNDINEGVDRVKMETQRILSVASTSGSMDDVLKEKNELILASSPIGSEALRFPEALDRWLLENESNISNPTPIVEDEIKPKSSPILSPLQISGIVLLALLLLFTTTVVRHAKENEKNKNSGTWNREVFTYEGVDFMLDAGRRNASMEQQQHEQEVQVQILVKPKNETPVISSPPNRQTNDERITFMSMDDVPVYAQN